MFETLKAMFSREPKAVRGVHCDKCGADLSSANPYAAVCPVCGQPLSVDTMTALMERKNLAALRKAAI